MHCAGAMSFVLDLRKCTAGIGAPRLSWLARLSTLARGTYDTHHCPVRGWTVAEDADLEWLSHYGYLRVPASTNRLARSCPGKINSCDDALAVVPLSSR
jgi:hypothetical protein